MAMLKLLNQVLAFSLELWMLYMLGYSGYQNGKGTGWKYALAIALPVVAVLLWGYFAAPKSDHRLVFPYLTMFKLTLFGITAFLWYKSGHQQSALVFTGLVLLSECTAVVLKQ